MEYGRLIVDAWRLTWRHRFLWILGLFAGGSSGFSGGGGPRWGMDQPRFDLLEPGPWRVLDVAATWLLANLGLIVLIAMLAAFVGVAFLILSLIAQGGMATATAELARGRDTSLGRAWRAGLRLFWRYAGLWLVLLALGAAIAAAIGAAVAGFIMTGGATNAPRAAIVAMALVVGVPLVLAAVAAGIVFSIVVTFAQRAIAVENVGALTALRSSWQLFRAHVGTGLLVWLLGVVLGIGAGIAVAIGVVVVLIPLGFLGVAAWAVACGGSVLIGYFVLAVLALLAGILTFAAVANTYFWHYWTLAYLRLAHPETPADPVAPHPAV
jgi:hypothetical protein